MKATLRPDKLHIDASTSCQLRCPTCQTTENGYPPLIGNGYLRFEHFKQTLDDNPQIRNIMMENKGEMFLNPELLSIIEYAHEKGVPVSADSGVNLNSVGPEVLEGLVKYRFRSMLCSIDGATPETYALYRRNGDFDTVIGHVRLINEFKKKYRSKYPELTWQFVVFGHNEHEIPAAREMARSLNMFFELKMSWDSGYSPVRDVEFVKHQTGWPAVTREEYETITGRHYQRTACYSLWNSPRINWDGKVLGCCWNIWADFGSNIFSDGYVDAINNDRISHARAMLLGKAEERKDLPCTTCALYKGMKRSGNFLTEKEIYARETFLYRSLRSIYRAIPGLRTLRKRFEQRRVN